MQPAKYLLLLSIVISFTQSACKKGETPKDKTRTELLTQKPWVLIAVHTKVSAPLEWLDMTKDQPACIMDNTYTYTPSGGYIEDEGATKCSPTDAQTITGRWSIEAYNAVDRLEIDGHSRPIRQLDNNTLITEYISVVGNSMNVTYRLTYGHP